MRMHETAYRTGLWLACGGFPILIAYHLIAFQDVEPTVANATLTAGAVLGYGSIGAGICISMRAALQRSAQLQVLGRRRRARPRRIRWMIWCCGCPARSMIGATPSRTTQVCGARLISGFARRSLNTAARLA